MMQVIINNEKIFEPYVIDFCSDSFFNDCGEFKSLIVPKDHFLVLGDNRSNSWDGRYWPGGKFLHKKEIIGILSFQVINLLHFGQNDLPDTTPFSKGKR